ncbi:phosphotransferase family protein [Aminobacter sp. LjRoot7]|uniref:phosphotransferase family protein n=1 Tax=Aminobacter sp. LjRoot7 TaxID=3342335 RepID=UPI003F50B0A3
MEQRLVGALAPLLPGLKEVSHLRPLSGGAVQETWAFDVVRDEGTLPLILRRARGTLRADRPYGINLGGEAELIRRAQHAGVPVPEVHHVLSPGDRLGDGFIMSFIEGETIPRRILRDAAYGDLRTRLAAECGSVLAAVHRIDPSGIAGLERRQPAQAIDRIYQDYLALDAPGPVFELAFRWLGDNMLPDLDPLSLLHGDFRNGNLLVSPDRLRAVLDWEGAHIGDPHEDLGYLTIPSWRFGEIDRPVGGFGSREDLFAAYEKASGRSVDPKRAHFWELAYTMNWGIQCAQMAEQFLTGADASVERGSIGRRRSETELDLLCLLDPEGRHAR